MKKLLLFVLGLLPLGLPFSNQSCLLAKADGENTLSLTTTENVVESSSYTANVYLTVSEEVSSISLEVHFSSDVLSINNTSNYISVDAYDSAIHDDSLNYSYIFSAFELDSRQRLFSFSYRIKDGVVAQSYYFDVVVSSAYNSSLEDVEVAGGRTYINVTNKDSLKSSRAYLTSNSTSTSFNREFTFSYYLNNSEPSSGTFVIHYDDELFEFVSLTKKSFFDNMMCDYNSSTTGEIYISFAEITPDNNRTLFDIKLRTIANVTQNSKVTMSASNLFDSNMNPMNFTASDFNVSIAYDSSFETHPAVTTTSVVDTANHQVVFTINLEENSHLGAGDFTFEFDRDVLTYVSNQKLISPTSFIINENQLDQGKVKFSIVSTTDIVSGGDILILTFSYIDERNDRNSLVDLSGKGLKNSLIQTIELDISGTAFTILGVDLVAIWIDTYMYMDDPSFSGEGTGRCISDNLYETAKRELLKLDSESINDFQNNSGNKYTAALARYLAWANANHDYNPFMDNFDFKNSSDMIDFFRTNEESNYSYIIISSLLLISIIGISVYLKRRKVR